MIINMAGGGKPVVKATSVTGKIFSLCPRQDLVVPEKDDNGDLYDQEISTNTFINSYMLTNIAEAITFPRHFETIALNALLASDSYGGVYDSPHEGVLKKLILNCLTLTLNGSGNWGHYSSLEYLELPLCVGNLVIDENNGAVEFSIIAPELDGRLIPSVYYNDNNVITPGHIILNVPKVTEFHTTSDGMGGATYIYGDWTLPSVETIGVISGVDDVTKVTTLKLPSATSFKDTYYGNPSFKTQFDGTFNLYIGPNLTSSNFPGDNIYARQQDSTLNIYIPEGSSTTKTTIDNWNTNNPTKVITYSLTYDYTQDLPN